MRKWTFVDMVVFDVALGLYLLLALILYPMSDAAYAVYFTGGLAALAVTMNLISRYRRTKAREAVDQLRVLSAEVEALGRPWPYRCDLELRAMRILRSQALEDLDHQAWAWALISVREALVHVDKCKELFVDFKKHSVYG